MIGSAAAPGWSLRTQVRSPLRQPSGRKASREPLLIRIAFFFFCCLIFTIPWENLVVIPGLGTVAHLVGYAALAIGLLAVLDKGRLNPTTGGFLLVVLFAFWRCLSYLWTAAPDATVIEIGTSLQMLAMLWLLHQLAFSQRRLLSVLQAYVLGTLVSDLDTINQYLHGVNPAGKSRFFAIGFDPNELALTLVLSLPLSLYLASVTRRQWLVWFYRVQFLITAWTILLTASRGPVIAAAGILLVVPAVFFRSNERQKAILVAATVVAVGVALFAVPAASWKRLGSIGTEISSGNLNDRRVIWEAGLETFRQRPILGVGAGAFSTSVHNSTGIAYVAHNTFLSILVEQGLIGFGIFLALYCYSIRLCLRMPAFERAVWIATLVTLSIGVFSLTWEYRKPIWLIFGLISLQVGVTRRPAQAKRLRSRIVSYAVPSVEVTGSTL